MTLFLRNKDNRTIVDIELNFNTDTGDLHSHVVIDTYSKLLIENIDNHKQVIYDFQEISELRGWFWEVYMESADQPNFADCKAKVKGFLMTLADRYDLYYTED